MTDLISSINTNILAISSVQSVKAKALALAESVVVRKGGSDTLLSAVVEDNGKATPTLIDDMKEDLIFYHKLSQKNYSVTTNKGYGNAPQLDSSADLSVILCGKRAKLSQYSLEEAVVKAIMAAGGKPVQSSFVKQTIWQSEFGGYNMPLPLDLFLIKISYRATDRSVCE